MRDQDLADALSDAEAYYAAGAPTAAAGVLLDALDECGPLSASAERVYAALGGLCCTFHAAGRFQEGKAITQSIIEEVLRRLQQTVDPRYLEIYATACAETGSSPFPIRRIFRHQNLINVFRSLPETIVGDIAECGCARGLSSLQLCLAFTQTHPGWTGSGFHIFDSFEGLSEPSAYDRQDPSAAAIGENMQAGRYAFPLELVSANMRRRFPHAELHAGWIPASFAAQPERVYRFVHIDVDLYEPTIHSVDYFFPKLAAGGIIITDDFNWPGARKAFMEFCEAHRLNLHTTDTTQAYVVKPGNA